MKKELTLKNDVIFKEFFARKGNEEFLVDFLNGLLGLEIQKIRITQEKDLERVSIEEKGGKLDLQATLNDGIIVSIEMQIQNRHNIKDRTLFYGSKVISSETRSGTRYEDMKETIMINILDFNITEFGEYVSKTAIVLDQHREYEIIDRIKWYFIELPKFRKGNPDMNNKVNQWLALLDNRKEWIDVAEKKNDVIKKAKVEIRTLTEDEKVRRLAYLREKWDYEYNMDMKHSREEGIEKGREEEKSEIAKKLLHSGMTLEQIKEITELDEEQIKKLEKTEENKKA